MEFCLFAFGCNGETEYRKAEFFDAENELDAYPYSASCSPEKFTEIKAAGQEGDKAFQSQNFQNAIREYSKGIQLFSPCEKEETATCETESISLLTELLFYRSLAYSKLAEYVNALHDARAITSLRPSWANGHLSKGEALLGLKLFEKAKEAYETSIQCESTVTAVMRLRQILFTLKDLATDLEIHQITPGREICRETSIFYPIQSIIFNMVAKPMSNFIYLIAHKETRECIIVDACWDIEGILKYAKLHNLKIIGLIISHHHVDHAGGIPPPPFEKLPIRIEGVAKLLERLPEISVYVHPSDLYHILKANPGINSSRFVETRNGYNFKIPAEEDLNEPVWQAAKTRNSINFQFIHTPGHTAGSQCILVNEKRLFSGDTLFRESCGRCDFPDSCGNSMFNSLQNTLSSLPDDVIVYPGHRYGPDWTTIGAERRAGMLQKMSKEQFVSVITPKP